MLNEKSRLQKIIPIGFKPNCFGKVTIENKCYVKDCPFFKECFQIVFKRTEEERKNEVMK
jgi:hypothetical protein